MVQAAAGTNLATRASQQTKRNVQALTFDGRSCPFFFFLEDCKLAAGLEVDY